MARTRASQKKADRKSLQARLKEAREATKPWLSQRALADKLGVTGAAVAAWESGVSIPRSDLLPQIARVLGVTVEYLVSGERRAA